MNTRGQLRAAGLVCAKKRLLAALRFLLRIGPPAPRQARCQLPCEAEGCWIRLHGQRILLLIAGRLGFAHFTEVAVDFGVDAGARHGSALGSQWLAARQVRTGLIIADDLARTLLPRRAVFLWFFSSSRVICYTECRTLR